MGRSSLLGPEWIGPGGRVGGSALGLSPQHVGRSSRFGPESRSPRVHFFGPVGGAASLSSRCTPTRGFSCGRPAGVSGVGSQPGFQVWATTPLIWVRATGLQVSARAARPAFTVQGLRGGGAPESAAAAESSLISRCVTLIFFFFLRNSSYSSPPGPNMYLAAHTAHPGSLPRILQQILCPGRGFGRPGPCAGPRDLIVLKHSSYCQIFQRLLSLVSDLHICWNTVGCSLCSSGQLGISLVLRGSGLRSLLSHRHLGSSPKTLILQ